ncbi:hypothetical protein [Mycoplasma sp. VS31B]
MNKWTKRFLLTGSIAFGASAIVLACVLGTKMPKKNSKVTPNGPIYSRDPSLIANPELNSGPISEDFDDKIFKPNKIHLPKLNQKPFENRELLYLNLDTSKPEKIYWINGSESNKNKLLDDFYNSIKKLNEEYVKYYGQSSLFREVGQDVLKFMRISQAGNYFDNTIDNFIKNSTFNFIWNKEYLADRFISSDLNTKNKLKDTLASDIYLLKIFIENIYKSIDFNLDFRNREFRFFNHKFDLSKLLTDFSAYKIGIKEFINYLKSIVVTQNNIEDIVNELDSRILKLKTLGITVRDHADNLCRYGETYHYWSGLRFVCNTFTLFRESKTNAGVTLANIFKFKLLDSIKQDIKVYNNNLNNESFNPDNYLHLLNIKYEKISDSILKVGYKVEKSDDSYVKTASYLFKRFGENCKKIKGLNTKYIKNKVIDHIINLRYFVEEVYDYALKFKNEEADRFWTGFIDDIISGREWIEKHSEQIFEYNQGLNEIKPSQDILSSRLAIVNKHINDLTELSQNYIYDKNFKNIEYNNLISRLEQFKGYKQRIELELDKANKMISKLPYEKIDSADQNGTYRGYDLIYMAFDQDESPYPSAFAADFLHPHFGKLKKLNVLEDLIKISNYSVQDFVADWKGSISINSKDADNIISTYNLAAVQSKKELSEYIQFISSKALEQVEKLNKIHDNLCNNIQDTFKNSYNRKIHEFDYKFKNDVDKLKNEIKRIDAELLNKSKLSDFRIQTLENLKKTYDKIIGILGGKEPNYAEIDSYWFNENEYAIWTNEMKVYISHIKEIESFTSNLFYDLNKAI